MIIGAVDERECPIQLWQTIRVVERMSLWRRVRWYLFGALVVGSFILGYIGFATYLEGEGRSTTDLSYLSLQLFVLESGSIPDSGTPWPLEAARWLAPLTTATAVLAGLMIVLRDEFVALRLRFRKGHTVICGLGEKGSRLASALLEDGWDVVGVERNPDAPELVDLRRRGALILIGDARHEDVLRRVRVAKASHVVSLVGSDDANAEVAVQAGELAGDRSPALVALAHIEDPDLCAMLRSEQLAAGHQPGYRLDFFNTFESAARRVLDSTVAPGDKAIRIAIFGLGALGRALLIEAARRWFIAPDMGAGRLAVVVVDRTADELLEGLVRRYPLILSGISVEAVEGPVTGTSLGEVDAVFVCIEDDARALEAAYRVRRLLRNSETPVLIELTRSPALADLFRRSPGPGGIAGFDLLADTLGPGLITGGTYEVLAQAIHHEYVAEQHQQGVTDNPALVSWDELPDSLKESNRDQASHIGTKLNAIGCDLAPLGDWDPDFTFTEQEVESLAELEHERWVSQRVAAGWQSGAKDVSAKTSPYLVPWSDLSDDIRELDRRAVRGIPTFLARAGYRVVRTAT